MTIDDCPIDDGLQAAALRPILNPSIHQSSINRQ
jgi:hypothetical protein